TDTDTGVPSCKGDVSDLTFAIETRDPGTGKPLAVFAAGSKVIAATMISNPCSVDIDFSNGTDCLAPYYGLTSPSGGGWGAICGGSGGGGTTWTISAKSTYEESIGLGNPKETGRYEFSADFSGGSPGTLYVYF